MPADLTDRRSIGFQAHDHANITAFNGQCETPRPAARNATSGFLVYTPHVTPWVSESKPGPGLLAAFGMGGLESLMWAAMLSTTYLGELATIVSQQKAVVVYAEFVVPRAPDDAPPVFPSFAWSKADFFEMIELD